LASILLFQELMTVQTLAFGYAIARATILAPCKHQGTRLRHATEVDIAPIRNTPCSLQFLWFSGRGTSKLTRAT